MRAKLKVVSVMKYPESETIVFKAVCKDSYVESGGINEDNLYALYTPNADLTITINNPNLLGIHEVGQTYYLDFTLATNPLI